TDRLAMLRDPEVRRQIIEAEPIALTGLGKIVTTRFDQMFPVYEYGPNYEPAAEESVQSLAAAAGCSPAEVLYDIFMQNDGTGQIYMPILNYTLGNLDHVGEMLRWPEVVPGLSDGGAHCGFICDASFPTFLLTHWVRDRPRGQRLPLARAVQLQTSTPADLYGFKDRGRLAPGLRADINIIDFERLKLLRPQIVHDLPAGGARLLQAAEGYVATIVGGVVTFEGGRHTGALPGRLVRRDAAT
ncbi:MAG: amidohydrolase family protein, partial [Methylobacterium sp.]|nr:amidohydrolase family protein [Methylobacterium sp.]